MLAMTPTDVSAAVREMRAALDLAARCDVNLLIGGGASVQTEALARLVHHRGRRAGAPFVAVGCAALSDVQLECRLFRDADALCATTSALDHADGGTLFLDAISELTTRSQARLMRVLDSAAVSARTGTSPARNVRLICATEIPLHEAVVAGTFLEDLYYRLNVLSLEAPPLTEEQWRLVVQNNAHQ